MNHEEHEDHEGIQIQVRSSDLGLILGAHLLFFAAMILRVDALPLVAERSRLRRS